MKLYTDIVEETDFHRAWTSAVQMVLMNGADLVIGGAEERKPIKDSCMLIALEGEAIKQIERREVHPQYPFKMVGEYCKEFTYEFLGNYYKKPEIEQFAYLYMDRLVSAPTMDVDGDLVKYVVDYDQIEMMRDALAEDREVGITSNRRQAITWQPELDANLVSTPCFQRGQIRYIPDDKVDVHLTWRSRDLYGAWQSNIICLIEMLNKLVIKPNECKIVRIVDFSNSLHIYKTDVEEAKKVRFSGVL